MNSPQYPAKSIPGAGGDATLDGVTEPIRRSKGSIRERKRADGTTAYGLRFVFKGERQFLSTNCKTLQEAERKLERILDDIEDGVWQPPVRQQVAAKMEVPFFEPYAERWLEQRTLEGGKHGEGLSAAGIEDLHWRLARVLPVFGTMRLDHITVDDVDDFRAALVRESKERREALDRWREQCAKLKAGEARPPRPPRPLSPGSTNKILGTLSAILEHAVNRGRIGHNVARGQRLKTKKPQRTYVDTAAGITALLEGAGQLDQQDDRRAKELPGQRRALIATLIFAGLRIGEALNLKWRNLDLARGTIVVEDSKTDAGERTVRMLDALRDELTSYRAGLGDVEGTALVFGTPTGKVESPANVRNRILAKAKELADVILADAGERPLPERLTPHSLRRTYASLLFAIGEPPTYVSAQMGHETASLTLDVYAKAMERRDGEPERLKALVSGTTADDDMEQVAA